MRRGTQFKRAAARTIVGLVLGAHLGTACQDWQVIVSQGWTCGDCECGVGQLYCAGSGGYCDVYVRVCGSEVWGSWSCY